MFILSDINFYIKIIIFFVDIWLVYICYIFYCHFFFSYVLIMAIGNKTQQQTFTSELANYCFYSSSVLIYSDLFLSTYFDFSTSLWASIYKMQLSINSSVLSFLYGLTLTSIHDYRKNHHHSNITFINFYVNPLEKSLEPTLNLLSFISLSTCQTYAAKTLV